MWNNSVMETVLLKNVWLSDANEVPEPLSVLIVNGKFADTFEADKNFAGATTIDAADLQLFPGFIDIHTHGAVGIDVNVADVEGLLSIAGFLARNGVTAWMPTLVPDSDDNYARSVRAIDKLMDIQHDREVAQALGVHYEGVFASGKMCGALRPEYFKKYTGKEVEELPRLRAGIHMTTLAPEIEGGIDLVRDLTARGWVCSIGHTDASVEILDQAFSAGARHITHFFNAMSGLHHRKLGVVGWGFTKSEATFDIIADGTHVDPAMLSFACRSKSPENVSLISDSVAPTGLGDGEFALWGERVVVDKGRTRNDRGSIAGSVTTMLEAVRLMRELDFSRAEVSKMASLNPARVLGIDSNYGSIEIGKQADIVGMDQSGELRLVVIGGNVVRI
jgi:N-acetylglucosamine-6-phosphate deacetylase